jgi:hypothetical protein
MNPTTVTIAGARGGHGTTTIATALALLVADHQPVLLVSPDAPALLALPEPAGLWEPRQITPTLRLGPPGTAEGGATVIDAGRIGTHDQLPGTVYAVLRGPCYLGVRELAVQAPQPGGIILLQEDGRSLSQRDVEDVLGVPVVARIRHTARVARTVDAGLLAARLHRIVEFRELSELAGRLLVTPGTDREAA